MEFCRKLAFSSFLGAANLPHIEPLRKTVTEGGMRGSLREKSHRGVTEEGRSLREFPRVPLRGEGCCGVGGASQDSAGFGAM